MIYTGLFNLLGVPVGAVPVTRVLPQESSERPESRDAVVRALRAAELDAAGLPMGVQLVAPWWHEDRILAAMNYLDPRLRADSNFPHLPPPM